MTGETTSQPPSERKGQEEEEEGREGVWDLVERFRSNLVVGGDDLQPYIEDSWETLRLPSRGLSFKVSKALPGLMCKMRYTVEPAILGSVAATSL